MALLAAALLVACGPSAPATTETAQPTVAEVAERALEAEPATSTPPPAGGQSEAYPAPQTDTVQPAYPAEGEAGVPEPTPLPEGYPAVAQSETFQEPRFRIDQPLAAGSTTVAGQAPPGVAIAVLDVTFNGALLGTGRSDENGRFSITIAPELTAGNRIGVTVGELAEGQTLNQMAEAYYPYRGEGFMNLPNIGILFDTALVQP